MTDIQKQIVRQLEFYFSDANLVRDKFMKIEMAKNEQQAIPIRVFLTFKKVAAMTETINSERDEDAAKCAFIKQAVQQATDSQLQLTEDEESVMRKVPFDSQAAVDESRDDRIIVVSKIPADTSLDTMLQLFNEDLKAQMSAEYAGSAIVRFQSRMSNSGSKSSLKRSPGDAAGGEREFNGNAWVEFYTAADAQAVTKLASDGELKLNADTQLSVVSKAQFLARINGKSAVVEVVLTLDSAEQEYNLTSVIFAVKREMSKSERIVAVEAVDPGAEGSLERKFLVQFDKQLTRNAVAKLEQVTRV